MGDGFLTALAKARPDPGGGAAAAYVALVALALAEKVVLLELKRPRNDQGERRFWESRQAEVGRLQDDLESLQEEDVQAYFRLAQARREGGEELAAAVAEAIRCPAGIMERAVQGLDLVAALGERCQEHLVSDLQVALELLAAALAGAFHIASANLPLAASGEERFGYMERLTQLSRQGQESLLKTRRLLAARAPSPGGP